MRFNPRIQLRSIRRGTILYHGTAADVDFGIPDGPAWFSDAESVAWRFAERWGGDGSVGGDEDDDDLYDGDEDDIGIGKPRVYVYRVASPVKLPVVHSNEDLERIIELSLGLPRGDSLAWDSMESPEEMADAVCHKYDGWWIPNNYPDGDDILICEPDDHLELVDVIRPDARANPRYNRP